MIYDELLHIKALSHLSTMVKRELASVLVFEAHWNAGKVCKQQSGPFSDGRSGHSRSVLVVDVGYREKGRREGDDRLLGHHKLRPSLGPVLNR